MLQLSLLTPQASESRAPIFGKPASWLGFGENARQKGDLVEMADICFLYLLEAKGEVVRIRCPAIHFDETGDFREVFPKMLLKAQAAAERFTRKLQSLDQTAITVAWAGEYRSMIVNLRAREAA